MAGLAIPESYRPPLVRLAQLEPAESDRLITALAALPKFAPVSDVQRTAREALGVELAPTADALTAALLSLRGQMRDMSANDIAEAVARSSDLALEPTAREALRQRALSLLQAECVSTTSIAVDLQTQHQKNFQSARIFTDVRPVFQDDVDDRPLGVVISEVLQVQTWTRDGESEAIFIAMDEADLVQLRKVVDRALRKTGTLKSMLNDQDLAYFELEDGGDEL
jgi:hypothetical protein